MSTPTVSLRLSELCLHHFVHHKTDADGKVVKTTHPCTKRDMCKFGHIDLEVAMTDDRSCQWGNRCTKRGCPLTHPGTTFKCDGCADMSTCMGTHFPAQTVDERVSAGGAGRPDNRGGPSHVRGGHGGPSHVRGGHGGSSHGGPSHGGPSHGGPSHVRGGHGGPSHVRGGRSDTRDQPLFTKQEMLTEMTRMMMQMQMNLQPATAAVPPPPPPPPPSSS